MEAIQTTVNVERCKEFVESMGQRPKDDITLVGIADGVPVQYSRRYLFTQFG